MTTPTPAQRKLTDDELMDAEADMISRTIECCAQVAEKDGWHKAADAIRETFDDGYKYKEAECRDEIVNAIKRCAKVADDYFYRTRTPRQPLAESIVSEIAAAIRELKG